MRRDVLASLLQLAVDNAPSPDSNTGIIVAAIGAATTIAVALIGFAAARGNKNPPTQPPPAPSPPVVDRELALERFLMRQGFDPNKIIDGDEWPNDVKFF